MYGNRSYLNAPPMYGEPLIEKYEYTSVFVPNGGPDGQEHTAGEVLNKVAAHGWRLSHLIPDKRIGMLALAVFERKVENP